MKKDDFCPACKQELVLEVDGGDYYFVCPKCKRKYKAFTKSQVREKLREALCIGPLFGVMDRVDEVLDSL